MIKFFRHIRKSLIEQNKMGKYFKYAIGEILLVVIGILIALQINNWNENKKQRAQELHYLKNIKTDLQMNIAHIDNYIADREVAAKNAAKILEHYEGRPIGDFEVFASEAISIYTWRKFFQINNTFQELVNSGNLALISNDSIKNTLLNMETLYKVMKDEESHFRYDSEKLLYDPYFEKVDTNPIVKNFTYQVTGGQAGERIALNRSHFKNMLNDVKQKNGFVMAVYELTTMNGQLAEMKSMCNQLIQLIDTELK